MKKIQLFIPILVLLFTLGACKKYLDKAPGVDLTEDNIFKTKANMEEFMATVYRYGMHSNLRYGVQNQTVAGALGTPFSGVNGSDCIHPSTSISDEGDACEANFVNNNRWNEGNVRANNIINIEDFRYFIRWFALRQVAIVIRRVNEVPDADENYKKQVIAEVKFIRALNYMEMLKRYGGMPLIDSVYAPGVPIDAPRATFEETVNFILKDVNDAINDLPTGYSASLTGRATAAAAHALKSEVLLYAASPQFNTASPVLSMPNSADNNIICYGNVDANRWKLAADAAKAAIDHCLANGFGLIDELANRDPKDLDNGTVGPLGNYRVSWEVHNNKEIIIGWQGARATNNGTPPLTYFNPTSFGSFWSGIGVPLNHLKKYEDTLGNVVTWDAAGGNNLIAKYRSLDPRFKQSITYTGAYHSSTDPNAAVWGPIDGSGGKDIKNNPYGIWYRKYISRFFRNATTFQNDPIFRVNELYLNYAEALNEFNSSPPQEAYNAVNAIRSRSRMPDFPPGLTKEQFRTRLRNEIAIEMFGDDHRFWDVKRWLIAEEDGVMKGNFDGLRITRTGTSPNFLYSWVPQFVETRTFFKSMYLHPLPQIEVQKGNLLQNPGY